jgi:cell division topological specificity factor
MTHWLTPATSRKRSAQKAKDRLKLVLIQDRTNLSPDAMEKLKNELLQVISRYVAIDASAVKIQMTQDGRSHRLVAEVSLKDGGRIHPI